MSITGLVAGLLGGRQDNAPCPGANGTTYTSLSNQQFTLICGLNSNVNVATMLTAASFTDCMYVEPVEPFSFHPREEKWNEKK